MEMGIVIEIRLKEWIRGDEVLGWVWSRWGC